MPHFFVPLTLSINKPDSSWEQSRSEHLVIKPDPNIFLWIAAPNPDAAAVDPKGIKMFLANGLSTFPIKDNPVFNNDPKILLENPTDYTILCNWVFDMFIIAKWLFAKALWSLETYVLVNNNLWGKLFS